MPATSSSRAHRGRHPGTNSGTAANSSIASSQVRLLLTGTRPDGGSSTALCECPREAWILRGDVFF